MTQESRGFREFDERPGYQNYYGGDERPQFQNYVGSRFMLRLSNELRSVSKKWNSRVSLAFGSSMSSMSSMRSTRVPKRELTSMSSRNPNFAAPQRLGPRPTPTYTLQPPSSKHPALQNTPYYNQKQPDPKPLGLIEMIGRKRLIFIVALCIILLGLIIGLGTNAAKRDALTSSPTASPTLSRDDPFSVSSDDDDYGG